MSIESQFTPEQLQALINGETVSFGKKQAGTSTAANKNEPIEDVPEEQRATHTTPRSSVSISGVSKVTTPKIRPAHEAEATDIGGKITGWSKQADTKWDQKVADQAKAAEELKALEEAEKVIAHELSPAQILNKFNATQRVVERLQKTVASLEKKLKEQGK